MRRVALSTLLASCSLAGETGEPPQPSPPVWSPTPNLPPSPPAPPSPARPLSRIAPVLDVASTAATIDAWPRIIAGIHARSTTSFDRSGGNDDGFGGTYSELYVDSNGEHVIFDELGPGVLRTLWFTSAESGDAPLAIGRVRFYFDDEKKPRVDLDANALFAGTKAPFVMPLVAANFSSSGGFASWAPLTYRKHLRITTEHRAGFYQAHHDELPPDWDVSTSAPGTSDGELAARFTAASKASTLTLEPIDLDTTKTGAGVIDVLRFVPDAVPTDAAVRSARIRIWFDGAADPQVDVPLGFFFGSGHGIAPVKSLVWTMESQLFESRMPMPFWQSARIAVVGLAGKLSVHLAPQRWTREEAGTFEARFHEEQPTVLGRDFVYADVTGAGKIVATVLGIAPPDVTAKQWWEGDVRTTVDGARTASIHGTGHEDDHLGGWSNEFLSRPFSLPMHGCPRTNLYRSDGHFQVNGVTTMYRLWPGLPFYRSIRHSTEHGPENQRAVPYAAATFLYRQARERKTMTDGFDVADANAAVAHGYEAPGHTEATLTSGFEGENPAATTAKLHEYASAVTFTLAIDPKNDGVELRRLYDRAEAPRLSVVEVDGARIREVLTHGPVTSARSWTERDLFIPAQVTRGKSKITVRWSANAASPGKRRFNAARFEAWTIVQ